MSTFCDMCGSEIDERGVFSRAVRGEPSDTAGAVKNPQYADVCSDDCCRRFVRGDQTGRVVAEFHREQS